MPYHIKEKIVAKTDLLTRNNLQLCSKEYLELVRRAPTHHYSLNISFRPSIVQIELPYLGEERHALFFPAPAGFKCKTRRKGRLTEVEEEGDYMDAAVEYLMKILTEPRMTIGKLDVELREDLREGKERFIEKFCSALEGIDHWLSVEELVLFVTKNTNDVCGILSHLKPETSFYLEVPHEKWEHLEMGEMIVMRLDIDTLKSILKSFRRHSTWRVTKIKYKHGNDTNIRSYLEEESQPIEGYEGSRRIDTPADENIIYLTFDGTDIILTKEPKYNMIV